MWSDEEVEKAWAAWRANPEQVRPEQALNDAMRRVMTLAVELAAARGGTDVSPLRAVIVSATPRPEDAKLRAAWMSGLDSLGARLAVLDRDALDAREDVLSLRERLSAAEESVRELTRRAQHAEGKEARLERLLADERRRADSLQRTAMERATTTERLSAKVDTLSAAGQALSTLAAQKGEPEEHAPADVAKGSAFTERGEKRYPCSPTCTHNDARTPGHPERVKELSEAVNRSIPVNDLSAGEMAPVTLKAIADITENALYQQGAEAMRASCWEALQPFMDKHGFSPSEREEAKSAIEGATP